VLAARRRNETGLAICLAHVRRSATVKNPPSRPFAELAHLPLHAVMPKLRARVESLTLAEMEALLGWAAETPSPPGAPSSLAEAAAVVVGLAPAGSKLAEIERAVLRHALEETRWNVSAAARLLGVDRKRLERKIARHRLGDR
jgi:transcriptional regulator of acetoin/glycerol metabolism